MATVEGLVGLSAAVFGWDDWRAFLDAAAAACGVYEGEVALQAMTTPFGATLALGGPVWLACALQAVSALVMTRVGAVAVFIGSLLSGNFDPHSHLLVAPIIATGVFAMAAKAAQQVPNEG